MYKYWWSSVLNFLPSILVGLYRQTHPEVTILDPPNAIQHLYNNQFMLQAVVDLKFFDSYGNFVVVFYDIALNMSSYLMLHVYFFHAPGSCCIGFEDLLCGVQGEGWRGVFLLGEQLIFFVRCSRSSIWSDYSSYFQM